ncbi:MAG: hypothetical protein JWP87_748 [Labilithrix sp.]|nr:hypothetical protein [Labilithrix sp.]
MLRSFLRHIAPVAILLPFAAAACSDDAASNDTGAGTEAGTGSETGPGGDGGAGDGSTGSDGADGAVVVVPDTTAPTVLGNDPGNAATGVATNGQIRVDFSEPMAPLTLIAAGATTFTLTKGAAAVAGTVSYFDSTATFTPASELTLDTTYTATITTAATDVAGNALAMTHTWTFKTDTTLPLGPSPVLLGAAGKYVVVAKAAITNVPTSKITGNVAISPAAASYITGFSMTKAGTKWTSPQVIGSLFAADNDPPTPTNLTTAIGNMETAYTDAAGRPNPTKLNVPSGTIDTTPLAPGLYKWTSTVTIPGDIFIAGAANDVWIFQISGDLMMSAAKQMHLTGGARAKNVFWQVAGQVDLGTTAHAEGIVLSKTAIKMGTGASINGRVLAQTAVNLAGNTITAPAQ